MLAAEDNYFFMLIKYNLFASKTNKLKIKVKNERLKATAEAVKEGLSEIGIYIYLQFVIKKPCSA